MNRLQTHNNIIKIVGIIKRLKKEENTMKAPLIEIPQMILIGSTGQNSGKTTFGTGLIGQMKAHSITALKISTIQQKGEPCMRGAYGCGSCSAFNGTFCLTEETSKVTDKDTSMYLAAGANRAFFLKTLKANILDGLYHFLNNTSSDSVIICESNSLREVVKPGLFIMLKGTGQVKPSAAAVIKYADYIINNDYRTDYANRMSIIVNNMDNLDNHRLSAFI